MSVTTLHPAGDGYYEEWDVGDPNVNNHFLNVDDDPHDSGGSTVSSDNIATAGNITPFLRLNSTDNFGTNEALTDDYVIYTEEVDRPGGGSWDKDDLLAVEMGIRTVIGIGGDNDSFTTDSGEVATIPDNHTIEKVEVQFVGEKIGTKTQTTYCTAVRLLVTHALAVHPKPTSLECERESSPTNASAAPLFTAIFNALGDSGTATHAYIQVSEVNDFASTKWDSGWIDIADITHGNRCEEISYDGTLLSSHPPDDKYYWRIKFKDASEVESDWSDDGATDPSEFKGINRDNALPEYAVRRKLFVNTNHAAAIPAGWDLDFSLKTGERTVAATNGCFNEAVQASGGFQIEGYGSKLFWVYLGEQDPTHASGNYAIYITESLDGGETWETPVKIATAGTYYDTHYFPTLVIDKLGYIHVAYGAHNGSFKYARSTNSADISSWSEPTTLTGFSGTYPVGVLVPTKGGTHGRVYWFWRSSTAYRNQFIYSDDGGSTWSSVNDFIIDTNASKYRVYCYGYRYDLNSKRLHIAYTHNHAGDVEKGVWYIYSDLDELYNPTPPTPPKSGGEQYGFNVWRYADDTIAGYSSETGGTPVGYETVKAIVIADDHLARTFIECLELDASGKPIVFWEQKTIPKAATNETYLVCATWNGSSWDTHYISDQVNRMLRVRRSSIGLGRDKDNVIRAIMPVRAKTWWHFNPTADLDSVDITRKSEASNYLEVDEGPTDCNKDGSYFDVGTSSGKASFSSNTDMIDGTREIFTLEIRAIVKHLGTNTSCYLYVDDGETEDDSDSINVDSATYEEVSATWDENPFTSAAWTKSDLDSLQFGIKQAGANEFRVTRVFARARHTLQSDEEWGASEIFELTSSDNGATWKMSRELSRNSGIGTPIMNSAHHLHNNRMHVIWTSGFDLFYLTDKRFGLVQFTGDDLRVYYAGAEIDRVLDYANKDETLITFKCQAEIPANRRAGADDYYVYHGNPNETTAAMSDPHGVYHRDFNNWEQHARYANLHGQDGWTVSGGTASAYSSPPDVSNKVGAGDISAQCTPSASDFAMVKTIGSGLTNVRLDIFFWMESRGGYERAWAEFEDSEGNIFGAGLDKGEVRAAYKVDESWTNSDLYANYKSLNHLRLRVTSAGCSAWWNGNLIISEVSAITSVDKLRLCCNALTYFDFSRVGYSWATSGVSDPEVIVQDEEWRGFRIDATLSGRGSDSYIIDANIGGYFIRHGSGLPAASRSGLRVDEAISLEHGGKIPVSVSLPAASGSGLGVDHNVSLEHVGGLLTSAVLPSASGSGYNTERLIATEMISSLLRDSRLPMSMLWSLPVNLTMPVEAGGGYNTTRTVIVETASGFVSLSLLPLEKIRHIAASTIMPLDAGQGLDRASVIPIGLANLLAYETVIPVQVLGNYQRDSVVPVGTILAFQGTAMLPVGVGDGFVVAHHVEIEALTAIQANRLVIIEHLTSPSVSSRLPMEILMSIIADKVLPVGTGGGLTMSSSAVIEYLGGLTAPQTVPLGWLMALGIVDGTIPIDFGYGLQADWPLPIDNLANLSADQAVPVEFIGTIDVTVASKLPIGWLNALKIDRKLVLEFGQGGRIDRLGPVSILANLVAKQSIPIGLLKALGLDHLFGLEFGSGFHADQPLPISTPTSLAAPQVIPLDYLGNIDVVVTDKLPIELGDSLAAEYKLPTGYLQALLHQSLAPLEILRAVDVINSGRLPVGYRTGIIALRAMPVESIRGLDLSGQLAAGMGAGIVCVAHVPLESLERKSILGRLPVAIRQALAVNSCLPTDYTGALAIAAVMPVGYLGTVQPRMAVIPIGIGGGLLVSPNLPVSWVWSPEYGSSLPVESRYGFIGNSRVPVEILELRSIAGRAPLESLATIAIKQQMPVEVIGIIEIAITDRLPIELGGGFATEHGLPIGHIGSLYCQSKAAIEHGTGIAALSIMPAESMWNLCLYGRLIVETRTGVVSIVHIPIGLGEGFFFPMNLPVASLSSPRVTYNLPVGSRYSYAGDLQVPLEMSERKSIVRRGPLDIIANVAIKSRMPVDWQGNIELAIGRSLPVEFRGSATIDTSTPVEHLEGVEPTVATIPIAFRGSLSVPRKALIDWVGASEYLGRLAIESGSRFTSNLKTIIEILERKYMSGRTPVGFRQAMTIIRQLPVEWQELVAFEGFSTIPIEWTMALAADGRMSVEQLSRSIIQSAQPVEYGLGAVLESGIPIENSAILADIVSRVSMSWAGQLSLDNKSPVELGQGMQATVKMEIDNLLTLGATAKLPTDWTGGAVSAFPKAIPICWRSSLVVDSLLPTDSLRSVQIVGGRLLVEWGLQTEAISQSLIEYGQTIDIASKILADWLGAVEAHGKLVIENKASVSDVVARLDIEYGQGVVTTSEVPLSYLFGLAADSKIPVEWIGIFFTVMCIVNARLQLPGLINLTFTQPGTKDIALRITEIINASLKGGSDGCQ